MLLPDLVVTHHHASPKAHDLLATHEDHLEHSQAKGPFGGSPCEFITDEEEKFSIFSNPLLKGPKLAKFLTKGLLSNENRGHIWVPGVHI